MTVPGSEVRLRRSIGARLFAGWTFQPILTIAVLINIALAVFVSTFSTASAVLHNEVPAIPFLVVWIIGLSASAHADGDGVRWRYFVPRRYSWQQIERVEFGGVLRAAMGTSGTPAILIFVNGREHAIGPAFGVRKHLQAEFAEGVRALATAHRVPATVQDGSVFWTPLLGD